MSSNPVGVHTVRLRKTPGFSDYGRLGEFRLQSQGSPAAILFYAGCTDVLLGIWVSASPRHLRRTPNGILNLGYSRRIISDEPVLGQVPAHPARREKLIRFWMGKYVTGVRCDIPGFFWYLLVRIGAAVALSHLLTPWMGSPT